MKGGKHRRQGVYRSIDHGITGEAGNNSAYLMSGRNHFFQAVFELPNIIV
jgi:hypothetical protein